jgi:hypothetical protein
VGNISNNTDKLRFEYIAQNIKDLQKYICNENYRGYDPYDILTSKIFDWPILKRRIIRFGAQQVSRRIPFSLRLPLRIEKGYNPVTLGLCIQAYTYLSIIYPNDNFYDKEISRLIDELILFKSRNYSGTCWGYDFDWEARYDRIPANTPTIVATGIITNALFENYKLKGNQKALDSILDSEEFLLNDLNRTEFESGFCFSYSTLDNQVVLNATMKGARLLSQIYSITKDHNLLSLAKATINFVVSKQNSKGAWTYAHGDARNWVDNYHTGYILDCLDEYIKLSDDHDFDSNLEMGISYYQENFFENNGTPKFYDRSIYPVDSTAAAQSIISLSRFGFIDEAKRTVIWMLNNMLSNKGYFYYRKHKYYTQRISFMRWSNAWMFCALCKIYYTINNNTN